MTQLNHQDIADHLDMSPRNLRNVLDDLGLDWRTSSIDQIRVAYIRKLRESASGRTDQDLSAVRARKELAQAMREELELAKEFKLVILSDAIAPSLSGLMKEILLQVIQAGRKAIQDLNAKHQIKADDNILLEPLRTALRNCAGSGDKLVALVTGGPSRAVSSALGGSEDMDRTERQDSTR